VLTCATWPSTTSRATAKRTRDADRAGHPFLTIERAIYRLTAEVADWFGLDAGTLREGDRADFVVIDPAGLDDSVNSYHRRRSSSTAA